MIFNGLQKKGSSTSLSGAKSAATKVAKAVIRYNPLSVTARLGFLAAMKLNLKGMGSKLKWAYASQQQAAAKGISAGQWQRAKQALSKIEALYADKLQGKRDALRDAILKGKAGGLSGAVEPDAYELGSLGEPVTIGASIAAATPLIPRTLHSLRRRVWQSILFTLFFFRLKYYSNLLMKLLKTLALRNYTRFQTCVRNLPAQKKLTIKMCQRFILLSIIFYLL